MNMFVTLHLLYEPTLKGFYREHGQGGERVDVQFSLFF